MKNEYDVIVVGAGPTGTHLARVLAKQGIKVIVLERQQEIGEPNFSTAGTPIETFKKFDIPLNVAPYEWDKFVISTPNYNKIYEFKKNSGRVFDFRKLHHFLASEAAVNGAEIAVGVNVLAPELENGKVIGVRYKGLVSEGIIKAKIVVDATGSESAIARQLKLTKPASDMLAVGLELQMTDVKLPVENTLYYWLGDKFIPNGYAWVFPLSPSESKVGIARWLATDKKYDLKNGVKDFIESIPWLKDAQPLEFHGGKLLFNSDLDNFVADGFINLTFTANPLGGEGIRQGLQAAEFASEVITDALSSGDFAKKKLEKYNGLWLNYSMNSWKLSNNLAKLVYGDTSDEKIDSHFNAIKDITPDDLFDILFHYKFKENGLKLLKNAGISEFKKIARLF